MWHDYFPEAVPPVVKDGRGSLNARASREFVALPRWTRTLPVVLHEISHSLVKEIFDEEALSQMDGHGPEFARVFIQLLERYTPLSATMLTKTAKENGVEVAGEDILETSVV